MEKYFVPPAIQTFYFLFIKQSEIEAFIDLQFYEYHLYGRVAYISNCNC